MLTRSVYDNGAPVRPYRRPRVEVFVHRFFLLAVLAAASALAQTSGSINGTVTDASQAIVPDAQLTLTNAGTGESREVRSSREGYFTIVDLSPGSYNLRVTAPGFKSLVQGPLVLTVGQQLTVRLMLQVGVVSESVEVLGTPPPVTTYSSSVSQLVDSRRIMELPLNGRNALQLVSLAPGVISGGTAGQFGATQVTFNVSGGRNIDVNFMLDGGQNMNSFYDIANSYPNPDTLQEFAVSTRQYSAAFGRGTASVTAVSKSGTNEFHGSAFEFVRNTVLDARSFFANSRSIFKRNQYGGTVGGPIARNKAFFLVGYQGTKARGTPGETNMRTFTVAERAGDFSGWATALKDPDNGNAPFPNNIIPASRIRPFAKNFISKYMQLPNSGPDYYRFTLATKQDQNQLTTRVDYSINDNNKIWFRYFLDNTPQVGSNGGNSIDSNFVSSFPTRFQNYNLGYTRVFSPNLINDLRITYARSAFGVINDILKFSLAELGLPVDLTNSTSDHGLTPQSVMAVTGHFTINIGAPTRDIMPTTHIADTLTWMRGKHQIAIGAEVYRNRVNEIQNWLTGGNISFNGAASGIAAADLLLGKFNSYRQISGFASRLRQTLPAFFVQDDIRATRRLTVNIGVRWDPSRSYVSEDGLLMTFVPGVQSTKFPNAPAGLLYPGDAGLPDGLEGSRWSNIAPRGGIAWDVRGNGRTSIRAGFGLYFVPTTRGITYNRFPLIQPFTADVTVTGGDINSMWNRPPFNGVSPFPTPNVADKETLRRAPFLATANETSLALPFKSQSEQQWSFSIQQAIGKDSVVEAAYVGSAASHLTTSVEANPAVFTPTATLANLQQRRLYPNIGSINAIANILSSNYNGLQISFNRRYSGGLSIQSAYTWSKALGVVGAQGEGNQGPRDPNNYRIDYGPLSSDRKHNFVSSVLWNIPWGDRAGARWVRQVAGGWQLSTILSMVSGEPLTVRSGRDNSLLGIANDTADISGDWRLPDNRSKADKIMKWFNPAAFKQNATGTFGATGIGFLRGAGNFNCDIGLSKSVNFSEQRSLQFRASFFNAFNHANLGNPNTTVTAAAFGRITGASTPRIIEFGLKLAF